MKNKIIFFTIGLLVGAVIATSAFYIYSKVTTCNTTNNSQMQMPGGNPPSMPNGQNDEDGQPPEKPGDENGQSSEKSGDNNTQDSDQDNDQNSN